MSLPELAERLLRSFSHTAALLQQLLDGMLQRRTAWISARPSRLAEPADELAQLAQRIAAEETARGEILAAIAAVLPPVPGVAPARRHLDVGAIAAHLPPAAALRLQRAAATATARAKELRREIAFGERLLRFSARAQDALLQRLTEQATPRAPVYDKMARQARSGGGLGSLVDGRL